MDVPFDLNLLMIILPFIFIGGFVDAIAGGGGVITWVGFLASGVPIHAAYSTNKIQAFFGTAVAAFNYLKEGHFNKWYIPFATIGAIIGSTSGSYLVTLTSEQTLKYIMMGILPIIAVIMTLNKKGLKTSTRNFTKKQLFILTFIMGLILGFYDGFIGPGTGTFLIIGFMMLGLSMLEANGNAKIINNITSLSSTMVFFISGKVVWWLAIPCIITNIIAAQIGSKMAIKNGEKIIRPVMLFIMALLFIKFAFDIFS